MPQPTTFDEIINRYAEGVAFITEKEPPTSITDFIWQLETAVELLTEAGITLAEHAGPAAVAYLIDAQHTQSSPDQQTLLRQAADHLYTVNDAVDEYRLML